MLINSRDNIWSHHTLSLFQNNYNTIHFGLSTVLSVHWCSPWTHKNMKSDCVWPHYAEEEREWRRQEEKHVAGVSDTSLALSSPRWAWSDQLCLLLSPGLWQGGRLVGVSTENSLCRRQVACQNTSSNHVSLIQEVRRSIRERDTVWDEVHKTCTWAKNRWKNTPGKVKAEVNRNKSHL